MTHKINAGIRLDKPLNIAIETLRFYADPKNKCPGAAAREALEMIDLARRAEPSVTEGDERALFEADTRELYPVATFGRFPMSDNYNVSWVQEQWGGWQRRAALASPAVPEGYKLVPIEPTPEMQQAGFDTPGAHAYNASYRAMVAASPAVSQKDGAAERIMAAVKRVHDAAYNFNASKFVLGSKEHYAAAHEYQAAQDNLIREAIAAPQAATTASAPAAAVRAAERIDAMHKGVVGVFAAIKAEHEAATTASASGDDFALSFSREDWGVIFDGVMLDIERSDKRKATNSESNSDARAEQGRTILAAIRAAALTQQGASQAPGRDATAALQKLCDQIDGMRRTMFLRPGTGQNYSYLVHEDVAAYIEEARAALARAPLPAQENSNEALAGRTVSVDVSTCDDDAGNRIFAELTGETGSDGTTLIAIETSRNFAAPAQAGDARSYIDWWTSIETDVRKSMMVFAHREPERLHALVKQAYEEGQQSVRAAMSASKGKTQEAS